MTPIRVLSLGAGVQSSALLYMMIDGVIPKADHAIFADTGWEPEDVYEHLRYLESLMKRNGIEFHQVNKGNIRDDFLSDGTRFASMPLHIKNPQGKKAMIRRQCTNEYKIGPLLKKQRELAGLKSGQRHKDHLMTTVIGISYDESQRMRDAAFPWLRNDYPLVDGRITRQDCIDYAIKHSYQTPPRSACIGCPFKSNDEWRLLKDKPKEWEDAVAFDAQLRINDRLVKRFNGQAYLHSSMKPLPEVDLRSESELGILNLFDQECEGMCGV